MNKFKPENFLGELVSLETLKTLPNKYIHEKAVLGIDIYKYSQYPEIEQIYIPVLFESFYQTTVHTITESEQFFFSEYGDNEDAFKKRFISTGDGGFQIFDNVIQAVIFAATFQAVMKRFCTGGSTESIDQNLYQLIDTIDLRYAITLGKVYNYKSNYFGPAIINNARILSKDSLNRMLIDSNSVKWMNLTINSLENLLDITKEKLVDTKFFKDYNQDLGTYIFEKGSILSVDIQKVGTIKAKETTLDVFNLHLQAKLGLIVEHHDYGVYIVSLGNLNTSGISD